MVGRGTGSRDLVDGVCMRRAVPENNHHGRVGNIVATRVMDVHSVRRGGEEPCAAGEEIHPHG
jgi:hypothetical protein